MSEAKPKEQITIPISPSSEVSDLVLFQSADVTQLFYLPRYRISERLVSGKNRLQVQVNDDEVNRGLTISLEKYPASELGEIVRNAQELHHNVKLILRYGEQTELVFQEVTLSGNILQGVLKVERSSELAKLVNILTDDSYRTVLLTQRTMMLAIKYDSSLEITNLQSKSKDVRAEIAELDLMSIGMNETFTSLGIPLPTSREEWLEMIIKHQRMRDEGLQFYRMGFQLLENKTAKEKEINTIEQRLELLNNTPLFVETEVLLEQEIDPNPFVFNQGIYEYIFRGVGDTTGVKDGLIQYQVVWDGISYSYYQEEQRPTVFRYLPHTFKLASLPDAPNFPHLSIQFVWEDNKPQPIRVQLNYRAVPFVNKERRTAEAENLRQQTHQELNFEPLTSPSRLQISIPASWSVGNQPHIKESIDLRQGFEDTVTLTWEGFREVYNSLFDRTSILKGEVIAQVNLQQQELIPFVVRVDDFVGMSASPPDSSALLQRLLGSQVTPKIERTIQITTYPFMFNPSQDRPDDPAIAILVDFFERGNKISLTPDPDKLSVKTKLRLSVSDYVLSESDEGDYLYQVTLIYKSGQQVKSTEKTGSDDELFIILETLI